MGVFCPFPHRHGKSCLLWDLQRRTWDKFWHSSRVTADWYRLTAKKNATASFKQQKIMGNCQFIHLLQKAPQKSTWGSVNNIWSCSRHDECYNRTRGMLTPDTPNVNEEQTRSSSSSSVFRTPNGDNKGSPASPIQSKTGHLKPRLPCFLLLFLYCAPPCPQCPAPISFPLRCQGQGGIGVSCSFHT